MASALLCSAVTVVAWSVPRRAVWRGGSAGLWTATAARVPAVSAAWPSRASIHCCSSSPPKRALSTIGKRKSERVNRLDHIEITFLGTSSAAPTKTRNQQSLAMQLGGQTWLFDCGEATQHRMMLTTLTPPAVKRIFISHLHGDHCFGLPGFLCNMATAYGGGEDGDGSAAAAPVDSTPVTIVGPQGLRSWLRAVLGNSYATLGKMKLEVHELVGMTAIEHGPPRFRPPVYVSRALPCEVPGLDLTPSADGFWEIPSRTADDPPVTISAVELDHTVPTVGWVIKEAPRPGALDSARVKPLLREQGVPLSKLKDLKAGQPLTLPDGTVLEPAEYVAASTQRKLCILSDMRGAKVNATLLNEIANPTLLVHECTNAFEEDDPQGRSPREVERTAYRHGHSTPQMAGRLAKKVGAQHLALTHFSARYGGGLSTFDTRRMARIGALAQREIAPRRQGDGSDVTMAVDLMKLIVQIDGAVDVALPKASNDAHAIWNETRERA